MIGVLIAMLAAGQWNVEASRDQMSDRPIAQATLQGHGGTLIFRCGGEEGPLIALRPDRYVGLGTDGYGGFGEVSLRFDEGAEERQARWFFARGLISDLDDERVAQFADRASQAQRLRVRAIGRGGEQAFDFDMTGAADALAETRRSCSPDGGN